MLILGASTNSLSIQITTASNPDWWAKFIELAGTLVWPVLIAIILFWLRKEIPRLAVAFVDRVERGDTTEVMGVRIESPKTKLPDDQPADVSPTEKEGDPGPPHDVYLLHSYRRAPKLDKKGHTYYRLKIWVDTDGIDLGSIQSVTYHLHKSFAKPVRVVTDSDTNFELDTAAWGTFLLLAEVKFKTGTVWRIERFLN